VSSEQQEIPLSLEGKGEGETAHCSLL